MIYRASWNRKMMLSTTGSMCPIHDATGRKRQYVRLQLSAKQQGPALCVPTQPHTLMPIQTLSMLASSITSLK